MKNMKLSLAALLGATVWLGGCASTGVLVLERADDLSSRPEWASTTKINYLRDGKQVFVSFVTVDGGSSVSAAYNMADEKALSEPVRAMVDDFLDQNQVGEDLRETTGSRLISSLRKSRVPMPSLQVVNRYWERVGIRDGIGAERTELRVFSLAEVPVGEFRAAKETALARLRGDSALQKTLAEIGKAQRDRAAE